ncbi:L-serine dehydratase [Litoribrevibacter albus]|uniref:L-serine dehydratase n=2 Tax=Litoribrevibacter albus TaxID=1473156 RepID=A0AA37S883_9GAMM|nr:L-serine dehydratase [Litoribrevibacter albus]
MIAARRFLLHLQQANLFDPTTRVLTHLHGSLAHTGKGHATSSAILMGLQGETPSEINAINIPDMVKTIIRSKKIALLNIKPIDFVRKRDVIFDFQNTLPQHPNGITFRAFDQDGLVLKQRQYFSIGGGFVLSEDEITSFNNTSNNNEPKTPYPFNSAKELLDQCEQHQFTIAELVQRNENALRPQPETQQGILKIWDAMSECIKQGCDATGTLPGGLHVERRANRLYSVLEKRSEKVDAQSPGHSESSSQSNSSNQPRTSIDNIPKDLAVMDWVNLYALAVNEQNAAGGRVVTAPTNGAAGVIPAVLAYYVYFVNPLQSLTQTKGIVTFLLTATAIGSLFKQNASISAAEVGCQGEVGVACSMAAAGLTAVLGGSNRQIENAAEIGMEHNLGLTCDPIKGLVQIPCIERNTMGAVQAINAARLALIGDGSHKVSLDQVIETMRLTGKDMQEKYKETSQGGLAVSFIEC